MWPFKKQTQQKFDVWVPRKTCPCFFLDKPCQPMCTCIQPFYSVGCLNCVSGGSLEQKKAKANYLNSLRQEVERLKRGDFTEEEFQNLCHNLPENCKREDFEKGCKEYQEKLFGAKEILN